MSRKTAQSLIDARSQLGEARLRSEVALLRNEKKALLKELAIAHDRAELYEALKASSRKPAAIRPATRSKTVKRTATAVLLCSDWHVGERVDANKVNGVNRYDPTEARVRARNLTEALLWSIRHHGGSFDISDLVLWLGGDLITGFLHEDQRQSNHLAPNSEVMLVQDLVGEMIDAVLSMPEIKRVTIPCSYGNHGRTTAKPQIATGAENSFEWMLYQQMRRVYERDPATAKRVTWQVADGEWTYLKVYDRKIRFTHGDATKFGGGVGGMTIPINKAIARWQTYEHAHITCMGHYHQYLDTPGLVVNGSLIGAAPYGMRVGNNEPPVQAFFLIDSKRGKCQSTPLWVTEVAA